MTLREFIAAISTQTGMDLPLELRRFDEPLHFESMVLEYVNGQLTVVVNVEYTEQ